MTDKDFGLDWGDEEEPGDAIDVLDAADDRLKLDRQKAEAALFAAAVEQARPGLDKIPDPVDPAGEGELTTEEKESLDLCVGGVELLSTAFWVAGKALDTMATGRLFRRTPHKLKPGEFYTTIDEWSWVEHGIKPSRCNKLRHAWQIGEVLAARGYNAPEGQVREIVPLSKKHGLNAAVALYQVVADSVGADKVTANRLREAVAMLPGDLALKDDEDADQIARMLSGLLDSAELAELPAPAAPAIPPAIRRAVDRRAIGLADKLNRSRIPRTEVERHLLEAFADDTDPTVFEAVLARMRQATRS
ncbi:hypothetical protein [Streptomyces anulatus]|uniref:hypothetical protein n=1 Tax=Streptomyces anulatus TaxID=1892 RepID=UPI0037DD66EF|nr:hypothetical protein OHB50_38945 [Streptomyces anulatus]